MHGLDRGPRQLKLAAGLQRYRAAARHVGEPDDVLALHNRVPAEQVLHAFEQGMNAAPRLIGNRAMAFSREGKFLVLRADAEFRLRLAARLEPRDEIIACFDGCHVDLVTSHAGAPAERARPYTRVM